MRMNRALAGAGVCAVLGLAGCGGGGSTTAPTAPVATPTPVPTRAEVTLTVSPPTLVAVANNDRTYPWRVEWTLVLRETAGLGGNVNYVNVGFVNSFGFETPSALNYGADTIIRRAGSNHLYPNGELRIPLGMVYSADGFGQRTITLKNAVSFTDDRGNATMLGATASVVSLEVAPF
jgi:hypothetical protein